MTTITQDYWDSLTEEEKQRITKAVTSTIFIFPKETPMDAKNGPVFTAILSVLSVLACIALIVLLLFLINMFSGKLPNHVNNSLHSTPVTGFHDHRL